MYCDGCGRPTAVCEGCRKPFDPPRFCFQCGRKLRVQVRPVGYVARCFEHGSVAAQRGNSGSIPHD
jgi:hypothetical protein